MITDPEALRRRNLQAFRRHQPHVAKILAGIPTTVSVIERDDTGAAQNLLIADTKLYPAPAVEWTAGQMRGFLANPMRITFPNASHTNLTAISLKHYKEMVDFAAGKKWQMASVPVIDSGYMFVYGIGLGHHLEELIDKVDAHYIVLIEPVVEFLVQSLRVVDWGKLFRLAKRRDKTLYFVLGLEDARAVRAIESVIQANGNDFIEGSYFYFHYYSWALKEIYVNFSLQVKNHYNSAGFFEDEVKMVTNAASNARQYSFHIVEDSRFIGQSLPVFIVGSGPSLDTDIEIIRKWRDQVLLFSSGTSLGILLKNGLTPDIHTEVENGELTWSILSKLSETYDLSGIILAASLTVDPRVPALFNRRWFFFRGALSSSHILMGKHKGLSGCEPTVANTSLAVTAALGFSTAYLFGVDCGYAEESNKHHSKDSFYYSGDTPYYQEDKFKEHNNQLVPGNFGGTFRASWVYDGSARSLGGLARASGVTLYNCSHGARIEDTIPKAAAAITLPNSYIDRRVVLGRLENLLTAYEPGELMANITAEDMIGEAETYRDAFRTLAEEARQRKESFWQFAKTLAAFNKEMMPQCGRFLYMARGSITTCLRAAAFLGNRLDKRQRRAYLDHFYEVLPQPIDEMGETSSALFRQFFTEGEKID